MIRWKILLVLLLLLAFIPAAVLFLDIPCSVMFRDLNFQVAFGHWSPPAEGEGATAAASKVPESIRETFACIEIFGNKIGVFVLILILAFSLEKCWWSLPLMVGGVLSSGVVSQVLKRCIERVRPFAFDLNQPAGDSFTGFELLKNSADMTQSFPSGHTTAAVALAVILAWLYPHRKYVFYGLALWLMMYRVAMGAHYVSDTLAGAFIGASCAYVCIFVWERCCRWSCR